MTTPDKPYRVLLIEDDGRDAALLEVAIAKIESAPYELTRIARLAGALEHIDAAAHDLLLLGLSQLDSAAMQTLETLSKHDSQIPVIVLGESDNVELAQEAIKWGAQDYLVKAQINSPALDRAIRYAIERSRASLARAGLFTQAEAERLLLKEIVRQMQKGVIVAEAPSGRILLSSEQTANIWRHPFIPDSTADYYHGYKAFYPDGRAYLPEERPLSRSLLNGEIVADEEITILRGDGTKGVVNVSSAPVLDSSGRIVDGVVTFHDITERKKMEDALREREAMLQLIVEQLPAYVWVIDRDLRIVSVLGRGIEGLGVEPDKFRGKTLREVCSEDNTTWQARSDAHHRALQGESSRYEALAGELHHEAYVTPLRNPGGEIIGSIGLAIDVTEHKRAEEESARYARRLNVLSQRLLKAQEDERRHIARELHDQIGQALTAVKINLQAMQRIAGNPDLLPRLGDSIDIIKNTLREVRDLSLDLRPPMLDDFGLVSALRWYVDRQAQRAGLEARFSADPPQLRISPERETACFRIAQEAVTNVIRHAGARSIEVLLRRQNEEVELIISDDGAGFDVPSVRERTAQGLCSGLLGMQERIELVGGSFSIDSFLELGTTIRVRVPDDNHF